MTTNDRISDGLHSQWSRDLAPPANGEDLQGVMRGLARYVGLSWYGVAFAAGYAVGTYLDNKFIEPLW